MKRIFYLCQFLVIMQILNPPSLFGQAAVFLEPKQKTVDPYIISSNDQITIGPTITDTTSVLVTSNVKWKIVSSISWLTSDPASWISTDGTKRIKIQPNLQWFSIEDITGVDMQGVITIEEDSQLPTKIVKTINVTFKAYPGVLTTPVHTIIFSAIGSKTYSIISNLPWNAEKKTSANWFNVTPTYSLAGTINLKIDCITTNASSKDNSVYLILKQTKGVVKDSILIVQAGSSVGITDYEKSGIKLYPQPAGETLNIDLPDKNDMKYWEIYNPAGIELIKGTIENKNRLQIPLQRLSPGLYFITLRSETQKIGLKFTK